MRTVCWLNCGANRLEQLVARRVVSPPLSDDQLSPLERIAILMLSIVGLLVAAAVLLHDSNPTNPLSQILYQYFLGPVLAESSADAGYNQVNTFTYAVVLILFVIALSAWLRKTGMPASERTFVALLPWVAWAALGEVVEDAGMFGPGYEVWFVSPGIHFHTAAWVIIAAMFGYGASRTNDETENEQGVTTASITLVMLQSILMIGSFETARQGTAIETHLSLLPVALFAGAGLLTILAVNPFIEKWSPVERGVFMVGVGSSMVLLGALVSYGIMLNTVDEGVLRAIRHDGELNLWIIWPILILPMLLAAGLYRWGREARETLVGSGLIAGVLPVGISIDDWEEMRTQAHDMMERLTPRAVLASPVVIIGMMGELVDGLATYFGLDHFGYSEKHVVSGYLIDLFDTALTFVAVKIVIALVVWWFFSLARFEHRQRHLRLLIGLAILVVGLAPGLRDLGRMMLGV